jgi:hypothetical protein
MSTDRGEWLSPGIKVSPIRDNDGARTGSNESIDDWECDIQSQALFIRGCVVADQPIIQYVRHTQISGHAGMTLAVLDVLGHAC